jgi:hypothetical protein
MIGTQKKLVEWCETLESAAQENGLPGTFVENAAALKNEIAEKELVVPVVGAFSSGKSTLLNACIGDAILPTAVRPETALAAELRYSREEYVEAVSKDGGATRYSLSDIESLKEKAAQYQYARVFLNRDFLKEIQPLVLVDMPGFDSPLDSHNKAILAYLARGAYYIVLSSAPEEKVPSASLIRHLREIRALERRFSLFVSKTNLVPTQKDVDTLLAHYAEVLKRELKEDYDVQPLGESSGDSVLRLLKSIDADALFLNIFRGRFRSLCFELVELLNLRVSASKKDAEENARLVREMEESIKKIERKAENLVADIEARYSHVAVNDLVQSVGAAMDAALPELVSFAQAGNQEAIERVLNDIVRGALTSAIKNKLGDIVNEITVDLSSELSGLESMMARYDGGENYVGNFVKKTQSLINDLQLTDNKSGKPGILSPTAIGAYTAVTAIISIISGGVITILEAVIIFLPEIIGALLGLFQKKMQENEIRSKFQTRVFPAIKQKIRSEIPVFLDDSIRKIIVDVREQYTNQIERQRAEVSAGIEEAKAGEDEQRRRVEALTAVVQTVKNIAEQA